MKQNMLDDDYIKSILLGLNCCSIRLTYPNALLLDFGKIIEYTLVNNIKKLKGEFSIMTEYCYWRVIKDEKVLCISYLMEEKSDKILKKLELGKLINFSHNNNEDFYFILFYF